MTHACLCNGVNESMSSLMSRRAVGFLIATVCQTSWTEAASPPQRDASSPAGQPARLQSDPALRQPMPSPDLSPAAVAPAVVPSPNPERVAVAQAEIPAPSYAITNADRIAFGALGLFQVTLLIVLVRRSIADHSRSASVPIISEGVPSPELPVTSSIRPLDEKVEIPQDAEKNGELDQLRRKFNERDEENAELRANVKSLQDKIAQLKQAEEEWKAEYVTVPPSDALPDHEAFAEREAAMGRREIELGQAEARLIHEGLEMERQRGVVDQREATLADREAELARCQAELDRRESELAEKKRGLEQQLVDVEQRSAEVSLREAEVAEASVSANARLRESERKEEEAANSRRQAEIDALAAKQSLATAQEARAQAEAEVVQARETLARIEEIRQQFWPDFFRGEGPLASWREPVEASGVRQGSAGPLLLNALHRYCFLKKSASDKDLARTIKEISRHAYAFWAESGRSPEQADEIAETWARTFLADLTSHGLTIRVARLGQQKDNRWMNYRPGPGQVTQVTTWGIQASSGATLEPAEVS